MKKTALLLAVLALVGAACGDSDDTGAGDADEMAATTAAPITTTVAETTTTADSGIIPGADPNADAIVAAYSVAFDSVSDYAAKAPYIDDPSGLEDTVAKYLTTGESMGGIDVVVTAVDVNGDEADVTYDLLFNDNPTYSDLPGTAVRTAAGWQIPRSIFCALMSSARVGCPAE